MTWDDEAKRLLDRDRARRLRELMEAKWRSPGVTHAHYRCKWSIPMSMGGDHGYRDDIADNNFTAKPR
jgi:hypothetical protein